MNNWITKKEAALRLKVSTRTVNRYMAKGMLKFNAITRQTVRINARSVTKLERGGNCDRRETTASSASVAP